MFALLVTGAPGTGKTGVLAALSELLAAAQVRHATLEVEAVTSTYPTLHDQQRSAALRSASSLYRRFGYERMLLTVTAESQAHLGATLRAVGADGHAVVALDADPVTLRRRISDREPEGWSGLDELLLAAGRLRAAIAELEGVDLRVRTESERPAEVAERILEAFPLLLEQQSS